MTKGEQIRELRLCAMVSQRQLAKALGAGRSTIGGWENNDPPVSDKMLKKIQTILTEIIEKRKSSFQPDTKGCKGCSYWRHITYHNVFSPRCCHYLLYTGKSRGCPPGSECTRYTTEPPKKVLKDWSETNG